MRYCPECGQRFDEDIIKFCTKDGTPLVEDSRPNFTALPSQGAESDIGEETVIRRKPFDSGGQEREPERFVVDTSQPSSQHVRPRQTQAYYPPPQEPNTGKVIVLTILGTIFVLACGAGLFWLLQGERPANTNANNINTNMPNVNLNTNVGFDSNFNFNAIPINTNFNINFNALANLKPSPSPRTTPTPKPTPTPSPVTPASPRPTVDLPPSATPRTGPRPPTAVNRPGGQ